MHAVSCRRSTVFFYDTKFDIYKQRKHSLGILSPCDFISTHDAVSIKDSNQPAYRLSLEFEQTSAKFSIQLWAVIDRDLYSTGNKVATTGIL